MHLIDYSKYFDMLKILELAERCEVRTTDGSLVAANYTAAPMDDELPAIVQSWTESGSSADASMEASDTERTYVPLRQRSGDLSGVLILSGINPSTQIAPAVQILPALVNQIEAELQMDAELEQMAVELTARYEELNLIYEDSGSALAAEQDRTLFKRLLGSCSAHLNVDLVGLAVMDQQRIHFASASQPVIPDPQQLLESLQLSLANYFTSREQGVIVNSFSDEMRATLRLDLPYKLLACAVRSATGKLLGILMCVNRTSGNDFLNSDRSLLQAVASKVDKILQSNYDELTSLLNRTALNARVSNAILASRSERDLHAFLMVDLAQMRVLNETHGRELGDELIARVGQVLAGAVSDTDVVGYLGEARFGVLLYECDTKRARVVAETLQINVEHTPFVLGETECSATVSIGIAPISPRSDDAVEVFAQAETAAVAAKQRGRRGIKVYHDDDSELNSRKELMHWASRVQKSLRDDRFVLFAQQIAPVAPSEEVFHFETLIRLRDDETDQFVSPGLFLPAAEQFDLMPELDRWVIDDALRTVADMGYGREREGVVSINLSGKSLSEVDLVAYIRTKLEFYRVHPTCVCFEVTETAAIDSMASAHELLVAIRAMGCATSLDDFGTGLSSFSYLRSLPLDYVKIDGSFVSALLEDDVSRAMVSSINHIGHVMKLKTVAEFVENEQLTDALREIGVDYLQGYAIAKPVPLTAYLAQLRTSQNSAARSGL